MMKTLCIATRNVNKSHEMAPVLSPFWVVKCSADYPEMEGNDDIAETGDTFLANATIKAVATSQLVPDYVLADDSGLECDALDGAPGVFSARYGGIPSSVEKNNAKLLQELDRVGAKNAATAQRALPLRAGAGEGGRSDCELRRCVRGNDRARAEGNKRFWLRSAFHPAGLRTDVRPTDGENEDEPEPSRIGAEEIRRLVQGESGGVKGRDGINGILRKKISFKIRHPERRPGIDGAFR